MTQGSTQAAIPAVLPGWGGGVQMTSRNVGLATAVVVLASSPSGGWAAVRASINVTVVFGWWLMVVRMVGGQQ
jgi:hypothetical protein